MESFNVLSKALEGTLEGVCVLEIFDFADLSSLYLLYMDWSLNSCCVIASLIPFFLSLK